jgi:hypothetical protein|tara:strand:- start:1975 stop:2808 length:834 start_codon:yes stop_codon:yes gene_type:complete
MMKIDVSDLTSMLKMTRRMNNVGGKLLEQVKGAVIVYDGAKNVAQTTNIVRDGKTSIAQMSCNLSDKNEESGRLVIADIAQTLDALKKHSGVVSLSNANGKLLIVSTKRRTAIVSDERAKAFPHTKKTLMQWSEDSIERWAISMGKIHEGIYTVKGTDELKPVFSADVDVGELLSALDCGNMNGQKVSEYTFHALDTSLSVTVGAELKGQTTSDLSTKFHVSKRSAITTVSGGLEHVLRSSKSKTVRLTLFDFTQYGAGIALSLVCNDFALFQREVV